MEQVKYVENAFVGPIEEQFFSEIFESTKEL